MIFFVSTESHAYTHRSVERECASFRLVSYPRLFMRRRLSAGTYIFTDFDRLNFWQLEVAAHVYRRLRDAGCRVLNDPARVRLRLALLRALEREGVNSFAAWPAGEAAAVDRFPVFVRTASAHRGVLTDLIADAGALAAAIDRLIEAGYPRSDLIVVEFRAEPIAGDIYRKLSIYRLGDRFVTAPSVHERSWTAKYGEDGVAGEAGYARDLALMRNNPYLNTVKRAFEIAAIDYGRADFAIVNDRVEIYEINSNPSMTSLSGHRFPDRAEAMRLSHDQYLSALRQLETSTAAIRSVAIDWPTDRPQPRRRYRFLPGYQWLP